MTVETQDKQSGELCKTCGLCCDGTFFDLVEVIEERTSQREKYSKDKRLNVEVVTTKKFALPCSCFDASIGCTIYDVRPKVCAKFKCGLLKQLSKEKKTLESCMKIVKQTQSSVAFINNNIDQKASFIKPTPTLRKFSLVYGQIADDASMQKLGKQNSKLLKNYVSYAMAYQEFFPKRKILPLLGIK